MRYPPDLEDKYDQEELTRLKAEQWMLDLLELNPSYLSWGPHEDYMITKGEGWNSTQILEGWTAFKPWELDDLNECVNFYFQVDRESAPCEHCDQTGHNPETKQIAEDWYDFEHTGRRWCDKITQHEVDALIAANRLTDITSTFVRGEGWVKKDPMPEVTAEMVNAMQEGAGLNSHDAINRMICVQARAEREGVYGHCVHCDGQGYIYTKPAAQVNLVLWWLHPRKGCSRGIEVQNIQQSELPEVFAFLCKAAERNAERFSKIPGNKAVKTKQERDAMHHEACVEGERAAHMRLPPAQY